MNENESRIEGFEQPAVKSVVSRTSKIKLAQDEITQLSDFVDDEERARRRRDAFCVALEKKYDIEGSVWTFNAEEGTIQITGKRKNGKD